MCRNRRAISPREKERKGQHDAKPDDLSGKQGQVGRLEARGCGAVGRGGVHVERWQDHGTEPEEDGAGGGEHDVQAAVLGAQKVAHGLDGDSERDERQEEEDEREEEGGGD